jgi:hypothetical protein
MNNVPGLEKHGDAKVYLSMLTPGQLDEVLEYVNTTNSAQVREDINDLRVFGGSVPLLACMDEGLQNPKGPTANISPESKFYLRNTLALIVSDAILASWDESTYYRLLVRGAGVEPAWAEKIADEIPTPDGAVEAFNREWADALVNAPIISDSGIAKAIVEGASDAADVLGNLLMTNKGTDTLFEWVLLGEKVQEAKERTAWQGIQYRTEFLEHGRTGFDPAKLEQMHEGGNPFDGIDDEESGNWRYGYDVAGVPYTLKTSVSDMIGQPRYTDERGNPINPDKEHVEKGRAAYRQFLEDFDYVRPSAYNGYALHKPEEGGIFGSIWKGIKKVGKSIGKFVKGAVKTVVPIARKLLPMAGSVVGTAFGGPIGTMVGGMAGKLGGGLLGSLTGGGGRKRALPSRSRGVVGQTMMMRRAGFPSGSYGYQRQPLQTTDLLRSIMALLRGRGF